MKTILIVEDDKSIADALSQGVSRAGFKVLSAYDGEEGLKTALKNHPDLIILDLMMPKKSGLEMLTDLRKDAWGSKVPVSVLTNAGDNLDIFLATKEGPTTYAIKSSMKLEEIINMIKKRLKNSS